ncbi:MAG: molybdopterin-dependent oxidoreductase [Bacteroidetes bacterium]|nr:molybdopterin-dependent oxidoreductase [Bacteroidota bacterium]
MTAVSRRRFLKISTGATVGAVAVAGGSLRPAFSRPVEDGEVIRKIPTYCDVCFWKCGAIAYTRNGKLWKVEGNPADPLSRGRLCPRGTGGVGAHYDPDRLRTPLIRKNNRGEEEWVAVTWDEALTYIAEKMQAIKQQYGPESMALFSHGVGGTFLKHTVKAYGSPNIAAPSYAQCRGPREVGFNLTFGDAVYSPERTDIRNSKCLTLIGSHLGENMHNTQVQEFADAVGNGASVIVVDPRFSVAASKAKYYLPIKPGTDMALILAWMNVLVSEELYDKDYVEKYGFGFDAFKASIAGYTPEWAYPITTIAPQVIRDTAREMARYAPASLVHPGRHVTWYGDDAQRSRAIALLNALLGNWGRKGGFYTPTGMPVPGYDGYPAYPKPEREHVDNPGHAYPFADEELTTGIRNATITGEPYPIKGWMVYATNLLNALPNQEETIKAIQSLDLLVVVDVIPSEIAGWADVVLPESVYLERYDDLNAAPFREPFIALRQPVVESPDDQKPNWWIARELAKKLGLERYYPWTNIEEYLEARLAAGGYSFDGLKRDGIINGPKIPLYIEDGLEPVFYTPSGKIEFYSTQLAEHGLDPVPTFTEHPQPGPGQFRLLFGRAPMHSFGRTQTNPLLAEMMEENELWINKNVAGRYGLKSGDYTRLKNEDGVVSNRIRVKATERIRGDCVYMVHGFGHTAKGMRRAFGKGASDAELATKYVMDPVMGGTGMNVNFVTIELEGA